MTRRWKLPAMLSAPVPHDATDPSWPRLLRDPAGTGPGPAALPDLGPPDALAVLAPTVAAVPGADSMTGMATRLTLTDLNLIDDSPDRIARVKEALLFLLVQAHQLGRRISAELARAPAGQERDELALAACTFGPGQAAEVGEHLRAAAALARDRGDTAAAGRRRVLAGLIVQAELVASARDELCPAIADLAAENAEHRPARRRGPKGKAKPAAGSLTSKVFSPAPR